MFASRCFYPATQSKTAVAKIVNEQLRYRHCFLTKQKINSLKFFGVSQKKGGTL
jgi:hypothetical protein